MLNIILLLFTVSCSNFRLDQQNKMDAAKSSKDLKERRKQLLDIALKKVVKESLDEWNKFIQDEIKPVFESEKQFYEYESTSDNKIKVRDLIALELIKEVLRIVVEESSLEYQQFIKNKIIPFFENEKDFYKRSVMIDGPTQKPVYYLIAYKLIKQKKIFRLRELSFILKDYLDQTSKGELLTTLKMQEGEKILKDFSGSEKKELFNISDD